MHLRSIWGWVFLDSGSLGATQGFSALHSKRGACKSGFQGELAPSLPLSLQGPCSYTKMGRGGGMDAALCRAAGRLAAWAWCAILFSPAASLLGSTGGGKGRHPPR